MTQCLAPRALMTSPRSRACGHLPLFLLLVAHSDLDARSTLAASTGAMQHKLKGDEKGPAQDHTWSAQPGAQ